MSVHAFSATELATLAENVGPLLGDRRAIVVATDIGDGHCHLDLLLSNGEHDLVFAHRWIPDLVDFASTEISREDEEDPGCPTCLSRARDEPVYTVTLTYRRGGVVDHEPYPAMVRASVERMAGLLEQRYVDTGVRPTEVSVLDQFGEFDPTLAGRLEFLAPHLSFA